LTDGKHRRTPVTFFIIPNLRKNEHHFLSVHFKSDVFEWRAHHTGGVTKRVAKA
jgi:hypothetical protein